MLARFHSFREFIVRKFGTRSRDGNPACFLSFFPSSLPVRVQIHQGSERGLHWVVGRVVCQAWPFAKISREVGKEETRREGILGIRILWALELSRRWAGAASWPASLGAKLKICEFRFICLVCAIGLSSLVRVHTGSSFQCPKLHPFNSASLSLEGVDYDFGTV